MDQKKFMKQILEFNQTSFNNTYNTLVMLQEQAEKMAATLVDHPTLLPEDGKEIIKEWLNLFKQHQADYKETVNENFKNLINYFE